MHKELRPEQIDILVGTPAVNDEFSKKVRELDRRLQMNGMKYPDWDTLNDRQHDIFTDNLFLDGECASSAENYVKGGVEACGCPDTEEELHHHSPVLMREIEKQEDMLPDVTVKIGEGLNNLNETIDLLLENIILSERGKSFVGEKIVSADEVSLQDAQRLAAKVQNPKDVKGKGLPYEWSIIARARMAGLGLIPLNSDEKPDLSNSKHLKAIEKMMQEDYGQRMRQVFFDHYPWNATGEKDEPTLAYWKSGLWDNATTALREMNLSKEEIEQLADPQHTKHSDQAGISAESGMPKTDIVIGPRRISVKLEGSVQLASGGADQMMKSLKGALGIYREKYPARFKRLVGGVKKGIQLSEQELKASVTEGLIDNIDKEWEDIAEEYGTGGYFVAPDRLVAFLKHNKIKSDKSYPAIYNVMINQSATPQEIAQYIQFSQTKETILNGQNVAEVLSQLFLKIVNQIRQKDVVEKRFDNNMRSWVQDLFSQDLEFKKIFVREAATGEATFKDNPDAASTHYLSPDSFKSFEGKEGEKVVTAMANALDFSYVAGDRQGPLRSKGRTRKQAEMTFRLGLTGAQIKEQLQAIAEKIWDAQLQAHAERVYPDPTTFDASSGSFEGNRDDDLDESEDAEKPEEQKVVNAIGKEVADELGAGFSAVEKAYKNIVNKTEPLPVTDEDAMSVLENIEDYINYAEV